MTAIFERRSIRRYQTKPVPREILEKILNAAIQAPSAINAQPWHFVALASPEAMTRLREVMGRTAETIHPHLREIFPNHPDVVAETHRFIGQLGNAPVCVLAFLQKADYDNRFEVMTLSVAAAIENLILAAWDQGVGSCWLTAPLEAGVDEEIRKTFAADYGPLVSIVALGYPEKIPAAPKRKEDRFTIL
jgi:nitroreductase